MVLPISNIIIILPIGNTIYPYLPLAYNLKNPITTRLTSSSYLVLAVGGLCIFSCTVTVIVCLFGSGMVVVAWPLLTGSGQEKNASISDRTQAYTTSKNLLVNGADALERILSSYKEVRTYIGGVLCVHT